MRHVLTLIADPEKAALQNNTVDAARSALVGIGAAVGPVDWLAPGIACDLPFDSAYAGTAQSAVRQALGAAPVDLVAQERRTRRKRLLVADMESTIIENEMLDEIAALAGVADEVAPITRRAMNGEIDFAEALRERVSLLDGLPVDILMGARKTIRVSPGARALVATMRADGAYTVIVSGGFRMFSSYVRDLLGFDKDVANDLKIRQGRLKGGLRYPVLDRNGKALVLRRLALAHGVPLTDTLAVGDGANDLAMIMAAGLGVAYHAKPLLGNAARARIDHGDLTALLYAQGYRAAQFKA